MQESCRVRIGSRASAVGGSQVPWQNQNYSYINSFKVLTVSYNNYSYKIIKTLKELMRYWWVSWHQESPRLDPTHSTDLCRWSEHVLRHLCHSQQKTPDLTTSKHFCQDTLLHAFARPRDKHLAEKGLRHLHQRQNPSFKVPCICVSHIFSGTPLGYPQIGSSLPSDH